METKQKVTYSVWREGRAEWHDVANFEAARREVFTYLVERAEEMLAANQIDKAREYVERLRTILSWVDCSSPYSWRLPDLRKWGSNIVVVARLEA